MRPVLLFLLTIISLTGLAQPKDTWVIRVGKLYDAQNKLFLANQTLVVVNGVIQAVGPQVAKPAGAKQLDMSRYTVTPGLIDMHTHLLIHQKQTKDGLEVASKVPADQRVERGLRFARQYIEAGITTVRDLGNSGQYLDVRLQKLLSKSENLTMYVSGPILSPPGGQFGKLFPADSFVINQEYRVVKGPADAREAVLEHVRQGINVIKVCMNTDNRVLAPDEIEAIVKTARDNGITVTAHATYDESARDAVLAGVSGIEHGYALSDTTLELMAQRGTYLVPTDASRRLAARLVAGIGMVGKEADDYANSFLNGVHDRLRRAVAKGVTIVSGSDYYLDVAGVGQGQGAVDVVLAYHEAGIPVCEVLQYATYNAAKALGVSDKLGSISKGMQADLVFFEGDLETDFAQALTQVKMVFKRGTPVFSKVAPVSRKKPVGGSRK